MLGLRHIVIIALTVVSVGRARADAPGMTLPEPAPERDYYRGQMVLADLAATGVLAATIRPADTTSRLGYAVPGALAFAAFGPLVHGMHHNGHGAAKSLALRVGLPLAGVAFASITMRCQGSSCYDGNNDAANMLMLGLVGAVAAAVIDDGFNSYETRSASPSWTPVVVPSSRGGATVGLSRSW